MSRFVAVLCVFLTVLAGCEADAGPEKVAVSQSNETEATPIPQGNLAIWINFKSELNPEQLITCQKYFEETAQGVSGGGNCGAWTMAGGGSPECQTYLFSDRQITSWGTWLIILRSGVKTAEGAIRSESADLDGNLLTCGFYAGIRGITKTEEPVMFQFGNEVISEFEIPELEELSWRINLAIDLPQP